MSDACLSCLELAADGVEEEGIAALFSKLPAWRDWQSPSPVKEGGGWGGWGEENLLSFILNQQAQPCQECCFLGWMLCSEAPTFIMTEPPGHVWGCEGAHFRDMCQCLWNTWRLDTSPSRIYHRLWVMTQPSAQLRPTRGSVTGHSPQDYVVPCLRLLFFSSPLFSSAPFCSLLFSPSPFPSPTFLFRLTLRPNCEFSPTCSRSFNILL